MIRCVGALLTGMAVTASGAAEPIAAEGDAPLPNLVWLSVEDMSPWLPCYGDSTVATPNIDRLAKSSVRYANAFATSPVCAPARSSLITGMYATAIGSMHHRVGSGRARLSSGADVRPKYEAVPPPFVRCFPELLRRAGYYCTNNSKTDYQFKAPATVWNESSPRAHWKNRPAGAPFFAVFNYEGTHESQAFPRAKRRPEVIAASDVPLPPFYPDTPAVRDGMARTYNNIAAMDAWVGERLEELQESGLLDNTIVFFFSDHGVGLPRGKRSLYDTGTRVPLLIRIPDSDRAGETDTRVVSFIDFAPTVLSLARIEPDQRLNGVPFLGPFERPGTGLAFAHADRFDEVYDRARSVTNGRYRYVRNYDVDMPYLLRNAYRENLPMTADLYALAEGGAERPAQWQIAAQTRVAEELYDSASDPWEVRNLADDADHQAMLADLRSKLDQWIEQTGDLGLITPESKMIRERLWNGADAQPTTSPPRCEYRNGRLAVSCEMEGASLGYRNTGDKAWQVYDGPVKADPGQRLQVLAHRIGFKPVRTEYRVPSAQRRQPVSSD
ncbi:MAG: sulfatase [Planctomycetales bacterium]|nr:sulfatase [Planctomycetales bacterium]